jgi:hypothetical protein
LGDFFLFASPLEGEVGNGFALTGGGNLSARRITAGRRDGGTITLHPALCADLPLKGGGELMTESRKGKYHAK